MNKFLSLFTVCIILAVVNAEHHSGLFDVKQIDNVDQGELKVNLKFTLLSGKSGRKQVVEYKNLNLKVGSISLDHFDLEYGFSDADDTITMEYELAEPSKGEKPLVRFGLASFSQSIFGGMDFCPEDLKNKVAPGEVLKLKQFPNSCIVRAD